LLGLLVFLVVADGVLTNLLIRHGIAREWNPILEALAGKSVLVVVKVLGAAVCALVIWDIYRRSPRLGLITAYACTAVYTIIVFWNANLLVSAIL
jgi:hypothetical protein